LEIEIASKSGKSQNRPPGRNFAHIVCYWSR